MKYLRNLSTTSCLLLLLQGCSTYVPIEPEEAGNARFSIFRNHYKQAVEELVIKKDSYGIGQIFISDPKEVCKRNKDGDTWCYWEGKVNMIGYVLGGNFKDKKWTYIVEKDNTVRIY
jgi:hypothetical protein